jgi:DNA mismatch repair protein MutL
MKNLLPAETFPSYFIFLEIDPGAIDINVHPTKTEIKFEDERTIWQILNAAVREALGKHNLVPSIDFDQEGSLDIPLPPRPGQEIYIPQIEINRAYNPFSGTDQAGIQPQRSSPREQSNLRNWESLYTGMEGARTGFGLPETPGINCRFRSQTWHFRARKFCN